MTDKKKFGLVICVMPIIILLFSYVQAADYEVLGRTAEREGKIRQALTHYVEALKSVSEGSDKDLELRKKVIKLVQKLQPPPAVPEEGHRYMARGEAFAEAATDKNGFQTAAKEFESAARVAPWLADAYYNLGIVQDKVGEYKQAMRNLELYLLAAPNASDAREVRKLIYKIEARHEAAQEEQKAQEANNKPGLKELAGIWRQHTGNSYHNATYYRAEITGNELLFITVWDNPYHGSGKSPGDEKPRYRMRQKGNGFVASTIDYESSLATQEIGVEVSKDYKQVTFTEWHTHISPPKVTLTYHKCRDKNPGSCGW